MRLMDRRLIFPAIALTASAQQPSPEKAAAESALRARVQQFFDLQVAKKYRAAEPMVAADSQDTYYNGSRFNIRGFAIQQVELESGTQARVTIKADVTFVAPGVPPMALQAPMVSTWKLENGQWVWFVDPEAAAETPFGKIPRSPAGTAIGPPAMPANLPDAAAVQQSVKIDKTSITVTKDAPLDTATIINQLPGPVDLELSADRIDGLTVELEKKHLAAGEKTSIRFRATGEGKGSGLVRIVVSPIASELDVRATAN